MQQPCQKLVYIKRVLLVVPDWLAWRRQSCQLFMVLRSVAPSHARVDGVTAWRQQSRQDFLVLRSVAPGRIRVACATTGLAVVLSFPGTQAVGAWFRQRDWRDL
jgi:hypothetical protein